MIDTKDIQAILFNLYMEGFEDGIKQAESNWWRQFDKDNENIHLGPDSTKSDDTNY
jgi:hypothetical protein